MRSTKVNDCLDHPLSPLKPHQWRNFGSGRPLAKNDKNAKKSYQTYTLSIFSRNLLMKTQIFAKMAPRYAGVADP